MPPSRCATNCTPTPNRPGPSTAPPPESPPRSGSALTLMMFLGTGGPFSLHHPSFLPGDELVGQVASALQAGYLAGASLLTPETFT